MSGSLCFMPSRYHKEANLLECQATPPFAGTYFTVQYGISWKWVAAFQLFNVWFIVPLLCVSNFGFVHVFFFWSREGSVVSQTFLCGRLLTAGEQVCACSESIMGGTWLLLQFLTSVI